MSQSPEKSLDEQVAATAAAIDADAAAPARHALAAPQRRLSPAWAVGALVALAATVALNWQRYAPPAPTAEQVLGETVEAIELTRRAVERYRDSVGVVPDRLADVGLEVLPLNYTVDGDSYEISSPSPFGDEIGYRGAARAEGAR